MKNYFKLFEEVSEYHWQLNVVPVWEKYDDGKLPWQSLAIFLSTYVFQTFGVNPNYEHVAEDTANIIRKSGQNLESEMWRLFKKKMKYEDKENYGGLKHKGNPLSPYPSKDEHHNDGKSLISLMQEKKIENLITYAKGCLDKEIILDAHKFLDSVRGVGPKIASLFLRDVNERFKKKPLKDRELLQPIDSWVRWIFLEISGQSSRLPKDKYDSSYDIEIAKWIVGEAKNANCNPERINMGMWYFGANVCGRAKYNFDKIFQDFESSKNAWETYRERMRRICSIK